jgi:hypothetical protein
MQEHSTVSSNYRQDLKPQPRDLVVERMSGGNIERVIKGIVIESI